MIRDGFWYIIANDSEREKVFAELYHCDEMWAEITQEGDKPLVAFFPPNDQPFWEFRFDEAIEALVRAKKSLLCE